MRFKVFQVNLLSSFRYAGAPIDFEVIDFDHTKNNPVEMANALLSVRRNGVALKGMIQTMIFFI